MGVSDYFKYIYTHIHKSMNTVLGHEILLTLVSLFASSYIYNRAHSEV